MKSGKCSTVQLKSLSETLTGSIICSTSMQIGPTDLAKAFGQHILRIQSLKTFVLGLCHKQKTFFGITIRQMSSGVRQVT